MLLLLCSEIVVVMGTNRILWQCIHAIILFLYLFYGGYLVTFYHKRKNEFYIKARGITMLLIYG
jgi:hypothetical protein